MWGLLVTGFQKCRNNIGHLYRKKEKDSVYLKSFHVSRLFYKDCYHVTFRADHGCHQ